MVTVNTTNGIKITIKPGRPAPLPNPTAVKPLDLAPGAVANFRNKMGEIFGHTCKPWSAKTKPFMPSTNKPKSSWERPFMPGQQNPDDKYHNIDFNKKKTANFTKGDFKYQVTKNDDHTFRIMKAPIYSNKMPGYGPRPKTEPTVSFTLDPRNNKASDYSIRDNNLSIKPQRPDKTIMPPTTGPAKIKPQVNPAMLNSILTEITTAEFKSFGKKDNVFEPSPVY
jgi:hypothetical protein